MAGLFYPAEPRALAAEIDRLLALATAGAPPDSLRGGPIGDPVAVPVHAPIAAPPKLLIVPHAGYVYSGPIAASAYAPLRPWRERIRRVVLLGPAHRVALRGMALPRCDCFETPLGAIDLDPAGVRAAAACPQVGFSDAAHAHEHALEVQLPFLQAVLGSFTLVPLLVGSAAPRAVAEVLEALWGGEETLLVISSDLSHYLDADACRALDSSTVATILRGEPVLEHEQACGATPINGALIAAQHRRLVPRLLDLRHSADTAGTPDRVVGYCAIAFGAGREVHDAAR